MPTYPTTTLGAAYRTALATAATAAINDATVVVTQGTPNPNLYADSSAEVLSVGDITSHIESGPMGPRRSRYETLTAIVTIRVDRPGGQEAEQEASDRAIELLGLLEHRVRIDDASLGGLLRPPAWCMLSDYEWASDPYSDGTAQGRAVEIAATFTAYRIKIEN